MNHAPAREGEENSPRFSSSFSQSESLLTELIQLCETSKIHAAQQATQIDPISQPPTCWEACEKLIRNISIVERAASIQTQAKRKAPVIIGNRRQMNSGSNSLSLDLSNLYKLSEKILRFVGEIAQVPPGRSNCNSFPQQRLARSATVSEVSAPVLGDLISYDAIQQRNLAKYAKLNNLLMELMDDSPQVKLLQVFARHQRGQSNSRTAWSTYMNSVSTQEAPSGTSRNRKSLRYGTRDSMVSFQKKRKSVLDTTTIRGTKFIPNPSLFELALALEEDDKKKALMDEDAQKVNFDRDRGSCSPDKTGRKRVGISTLTPPMKKQNSATTTPSKRSLRRRVTLNGRGAETVTIIKQVQEQADAILGPLEQKKESTTEEKPPVEKVIGTPPSLEPTPEITPEVSTLEVSKPVDIVVRIPTVLHLESPTLPDIKIRTRPRKKSNNSTASVPTDLRDGADSASWQSELRSAWNAEITTMSSTKRVWYNSKGDELAASATKNSPKISNRRRLLGGNDTKSREKVSF